MKGIKSIKVFSFAIIIAIMIISGRNNLFSQLPPFNCLQGYVHLEEYVNITIDGIICRYKIGLCVSCPAGTYPMPFRIELKEFSADPIDCGFDPGEARGAIIQAIRDPEWIEANIARDCFAGWGPCEWNPREITVVSHYCWKKIKYLDDNNQVRIIISACDDDICTCQRTDTICWNGSQFVIKEGCEYWKNPEGCISVCINQQDPPGDDSIPPPTPENPFPESQCFWLKNECE